MLASVSLRGLRDVGDGDVDLLDGRALLLGRQLDLARRLGRGRDQPGDRLERRGDLAELLRAGVDRLRAGLGRHHRRVDRARTSSISLRISLAEFGDAVGELADLVGDDGEALARLAGAGRLDRGVDREDVGLLGELGDDVEHRADLLRLLAELEHVVDDQVDLAPDRARSTSCAMPTVPSPDCADVAVCSAICATRCALSAICREVASSSLIVVVISVIAVACSLTPVACWLAAACSSADELCTWPTAVPICRFSVRAR